MRIVYLRCGWTGYGPAFLVVMSSMAEGLPEGLNKSGPSCCDVTRAGMTVLNCFGADQSGSAPEVGR